MILLFLAALLLQDAKVDEHVVLCHADFLRFWRVEVTTLDQEKRETKGWTHWILINDKNPEDKKLFEQDRAFYRENKIRVEYVALEGKLPE